MEKEKLFKNGEKIEWHILQSFPPVVLNRDESGLPKVAFVGGVQRGRVSSQSWKRAARMFFQKLDIPIGIRSKVKNMKEMLRERILEKMPEKIRSEKTAKELANKAASSFGKNDALVFLLPAEIEALLSLMEGAGWNPEKLKEKEMNRLMGQVFPTCRGLDDKGVLNGLDLALFGRMVASSPSLDLEAAACFGHSFTTHECRPQTDYFAAVDDLAEKGAGYIDNSEFVSGTFYRYICLDLGLLETNLACGDKTPDAVRAAIGSFSEALFSAIPGGKKTTFNGFRPWDYARVLVRTGEGLQASFEEAVKTERGSLLKPSVRKLNESLARNREICEDPAGNCGIYGLLKDYVFAGGEILKDRDGYGIPADSKVLANVGELRRALASLADEEVK